MTDYTRRTHVVRIKGGGGFVDVEVLDAIAFTRENGEQVVLSCDAKKAVPYIVDNTGDNNGKTPSRETATRRSHMKRITGTGAQANQFFDAEILDAAAFNDQNGGEWILTFSEDAAVFNVSDNTGDASATRRTHNEKKSGDLTNRNPTSYLTVERSDMIALRAPNGQEVILVAPSNDDPLNTVDKRAPSYTLPLKYDPTDKNSPTPPINSDPNVYIAFPKNGGGLFTKDVKVSQGPLWWIRNVGGSQILVLEYQITATSQNQDFAWPVNCDIRLQLPGDATYYDMQTAFTAGFEPTPGNPNPPTIGTTVTAAMLQLSAWSYAPSITITSRTSESSFTGWIIDSADWRAGYQFPDGNIFPWSESDNTTAVVATQHGGETWNAELPAGPDFRATPPNYPEILVHTIGDVYPPDPRFFAAGYTAHFGTTTITTYHTTKTINGLAFVNLARLPASTRPANAPPPSTSDVDGLPQIKIFSSAFDTTNPNTSILLSNTGLAALAYNNESEFPFGDLNKAAWAYSEGSNPPTTVKYLPQGAYLAPFTNTDPATRNLAYDGSGDLQSHSYATYTISFDQKAAAPTENIFGTNTTTSSAPPFAT